MSSWETTTYRTDPLRKGLVERARKRTVRPKTDRNWWAVSGETSLGDAYDSYDVHLRDDGTWYCACSTSAGGEYRKNVCSHRTAVILWRKDHDNPWEHDEDLGEHDEDLAGDDDELSVRGSAVDESSSPANVSEGEGTPSGPPPDEGNADGSRKTSPSEDSGEEGPARDDTDPSSPELEFDPFELDWDDPPRPQAISEFIHAPTLPDKFTTFRDDQWHGIIEVVEALDDEVKCVFLSAPTGTGKSLVAATVPQILDKPFIYTCTTHTLQHQVEREFEYAKVLKGRRNYPTFDDPSITTDVCNKERTTLPACPDCPGWSQGSSWGSYDDERGGNEGPHCSFCHPTSKCPYEVAKLDAVHAHMAVLNTTYFLSETNYVFRSLFRNKALVFIDEADTLEEELMSFITVEITAKTRKELGVGLPEKKTVQDSWVEWLEGEVIPAIKAKLADLPKASSTLFGKPDPKITRTRKRYEQLLKKVMMLLDPPPPPPGEEADPDDDTPALMSGWVLTGWETKKGEDKKDYNVDIVFKPIMVRDYARDVLWNQAQQFVLMSATIISPEQMAYDLGLEDDEWVVVEIPSSFPKERRPVIPRAEVSVIKSTMDSGQAYPVLVKQLHEVMTEHPDERILVHSNSYKLTRELFFETRKKSSMARSRLETYLYSDERQKALERYLNKPNAVLIAPSFDRGVDLHNDDCRVIVIAKVPFPYLGDKQVSARLHGTGRAGQVWYAVQTIRTIVQMTGRGMRCFSLDTEILTTDGWKSYKDIEPGMVVYGMPTSVTSAPRPQREGSPRLEPHKVKDVVVNERPEPVLRIKGKALDAIVTPDHSVFYQPVQVSTDTVEYRKPYGTYTYTKQRKKKSGPYTKAPAQELPARFKLPLAGRVLRPQSGIKQDWFWLMGMIIADGTIFEGKSTVTIYQSKPGIVNKIDEVVSRMGLDHKRYVENHAGTTMSVRGGKTYTRQHDKVLWVFHGTPAAQIRDMFHNGRRRRYSKTKKYRQKSHKGSYGYERVDGWKSPQKTIPDWIIQRAAVSQMRTLIEGLMDGDGSWHTEGHTGTYYSSDRNLIDRLQAVCALSGYRTSLNTRRGQWELGLTKNGSVDLVRENAITDAGVERTWCVNTELGSVVARRNGTTFIMGNSVDDWAISYIFDKEFLRIFYDNQNLFPSWWREALVFDENDPKWKEPLRILREGGHI